MVAVSRLSRPIAPLFASARKGHAAALGQLLSIVESGGPRAREVADLVRANPGHAYAIGITGAPGAGKSTLTDLLVAQLRARSARVAVLAIDPSSPKSGGAILGDRVRMLGHTLDAGVFVRSMASRGHVGGLALAAPEAMRLIGAANFDVMIIETVGVGQVELDIARFVDTTIVVVNPGWGDDVQAAKAGLLEIADLFVLNKSDRPGADATRADLESMLDARNSSDQDWRPPVIPATAIAREGITEILDATDRHRAWMESGGGIERFRGDRLVQETEAIVRARLDHEVRALFAKTPEELRASLVAREIDPWEAADSVINRIVDQHATPPEPLARDL